MAKMVEMSGYNRQNIPILDSAYLLCVLLHLIHAYVRLFAMGTTSLSYPMRYPRVDDHVPVRLSGNTPLTKFSPWETHAAEIMALFGLKICPSNSRGRAFQDLHRNLDDKC